MASTKNNKNSRAAAMQTNVRRKNNLRSDRDKKMLGIFAVLAIALITMTGVAVAAFSQTLTINGNATIVAANWNVKFTSVSEPIITGRAAQVTAPQISANSTAIENYDVTLQYPSDSIAYDIEIENSGDLDAKITAVTINTGTGLTCTPVDDTVTNDGPTGDEVCRNLSYTLVNKDTGAAVAIDDELAAGESKTVTLKLALNADVDADRLPTTNIRVGNLAASIVYGQKD